MRDAANANRCTCGDCVACEFAQARRLRKAKERNADEAERLAARVRGDVRRRRRRIARAYELEREYGCTWERALEMAAREVQRAG